MLAALLSNVLMLVSGLVTSVIYDKVIPHQAFVTLWTLASGAGLALVMEADHFCMHWRGVRDAETKMINSVMRGSFLKDSALRREFLSLIQTKN